MADRTGIEWAEASVNPLRARDKATGKIGWHCEHKTPGCEFCYAEGINHRLGTGHRFIPAARERVELFVDDKTLLTPLRWRRGRVIFWHSMTDAFADFVRDDWLDRNLAVCALTPHHRHIFLTKRPDRMADYALTPDRAEAIGFAEMELAAMGDRGRYAGPTHERLPLPNVLLGASIEDQRRADERREPMRRLAEAGWKTIVSYEPALGPVNWQGWEFLKGLISGGESGPQARGALRSYYRAARDFCQARDIAYFHKQNGEWIDADERRAQGFYPPLDHDQTYDEAAALAREQGFRYEHHSDGSTLIRVGKSAAGRSLDGREHSDLPR